MHFLLRASLSQKYVSPVGLGVPSWRRESPVTGFSIFKTSAPNSARQAAANGALTKVEMSSTRRFAKAGAVVIKPWPDVTGARSLRVAVLRGCFGQASGELRPPSRLP